jgi:hypothetical protein
MSEHHEQVPSSGSSTASGPDGEQIATPRGHGADAIREARTGAPHLEGPDAEVARDVDVEPKEDPADR